MDFADTVAATGSAGTTGTKTTTQTVGLSGLSGEDFMNILIQQLQYQDPMEPMDNEQMISQIANIRDMELNTQLTERLQQLTDQQRFSGSANLIGKHVTGEVSDDAGTVFTVEGIVTGVRFTDSGDVMLELDTGEALPLSAMTEVTDVTEPVPDEDPNLLADLAELLLGGDESDSTNENGSDGSSAAEAVDAAGDADELAA